jgi:hypothetical protein
MNKKINNVRSTSAATSIAQTAAGASPARTPVPAWPNRLAPRAHDYRAGSGGGSIDRARHAAG